MTKQTEACKYCGSADCVNKPFRAPDVCSARWLDIDWAVWRGCKAAREIRHGPANTQAKD